MNHINLTNALDNINELNERLIAMTKQRDEARECLERCAREHCELGERLRSRIVYFQNQQGRTIDLLSDIYNYAKGKKPHDYHNLIGSSDQLTAKFDAWQEIECKIEQLLQKTPTKHKPK